MITHSSVGMQLIASLLKAGKVEDIATINIDSEYLKPNELEVYEFMAVHTQQHDAMPADETVAEEFPDVVLPTTVEPPSYYAQKVKDRFFVNVMKAGVDEAKQYLKKENMKPLEAVKILTDVATGLTLKQNTTKIIDFRDSAELIKKEYKSKMKGGDEHSIQLGWESFDEMSGGLYGGDVVSYVGRPAQGKTFALLYTAKHVWKTQKKVPLIVSMEMIPILLVQRLAAMHTHKNLTQLKNAQMTTVGFKKMIKGLEQAGTAEHPFWIVDGNLTATVEDIWGLCRQLKPDILLIDGAYLMKHKNTKMNKFERIDVNAELIKMMLATELNIPVLCSYQFNREAAKKMKKKAADEVDLEDIGYSDSIGQLSSIVLGLFEEDGVSTIQRRKINIMKGRGGEVGQFFINWNFNLMDFTECVEDKSDLVFID